LIVYGNLIEERPSNDERNSSAKQFLDHLKLISGTWLSIIKRWSEEHLGRVLTAEKASTLGRTPRSVGATILPETTCCSSSGPQS